MVVRLRKKGANKISLVSFVLIFSLALFTTTTLAATIDDLANYLQNIFQPSQTQAATGQVDILQWLQNLFSPQQQFTATCTCSGTPNVKTCSAGCANVGEECFGSGDCVAAPSSGSTVTCTCDNPGLPQPYNSFTCSDPAKSASCSSGYVCYSSSKWTYPNFPCIPKSDTTGVGGRPPCDPTCSTPALSQGCYGSGGVICDWGYYYCGVTHGCYSGGSQAWCQSDCGISQTAPPGSPPCDPNCGYVGACKGSGSVSCGFGQYYCAGTNQCYGSASTCLTECGITSNTCICQSGRCTNVCLGGKAGTACTSNSQCIGTPTTTSIPPTNVCQGKNDNVQVTGCSSPYKCCGEQCVYTGNAQCYVATSTSTTSLTGGPSACCCSASPSCTNAEWTSKVGTLSCSNTCLNTLGYSCPTSACQTPTSSSTSTTTTTTSKQTPQCRQVYYSGDPSNKFNLVFVGLGDWAADDLAQTAKAHADNWLSLDPISANRNKVNVYAVVDNYLTSKDCQLSGRTLFCDTNKVFQLATNCPVTVGGAGVIQSGTSFAGGCARQYFTTTQNFPAVTSHELGHCFAVLADEYCLDYDDTNKVCKSGEASIFADAPNCDLASNCPKWASYDPNCIQECSYGNLYRSQDCSLMRDLSCFYYNEPSKRAISNRFNQFPYSTFANIKTNLIFMNLHYDNGKITVKDIESGTGYTPAFQGTGGFNLNEISDQNNILYSTKFQIPDKIYSDNLDANGKISNGSTIEQKQFDFSIVVPSFTDTKEMNIATPDNVKIQTVDVSNLASKGLAIASNSCHPNNECEIDLIGCSNNLNILLNKNGKPISSTILVDDKNKTTFSPTESGTIRMISFCFDNQLRVLTSDINVN